MSVEGDFMNLLKADAVFEGGGVKGIGLVGALCAAEDEGYGWENVAGTSAGAIVASLIAVGYSANEIKQIMMEADLESFNDKTVISKIPIIGPILSIIGLKGVYRGDKLENWLRDLYKAKGAQKFKDIKLSYRDKKYKYKLRVIASDIRRRRLLVLPQDISKYGLDPDELDIACAVRMSISIPLYYKPVRVKYMDGDKRSRSLIVDGGLLSNFPVWLFDEPGKPLWPTFGFRLTEPDYGVKDDEINTKQYIINIVSTMMEAFDERYIETKNFNRTIPIPTMGVGITQFRLSSDKKTQLFESGYSAAVNFFSNWDFDKYIKEYRANN